MLHFPAKLLQAGLQTKLKGGRAGQRLDDWNNTQASCGHARLMLLIIQNSLDNLFRGVTVAEWIFRFGHGRPRQRIIQQTR